MSSKGKWRGLCMELGVWLCEIRSCDWGMSRVLGELGAMHEISMCRNIKAE